MIGKRSADSMEDLSFMYLDKGLSIDTHPSPHTLVDTDTLRLDFQDWTLSYWTARFKPYGVFSRHFIFEELIKIQKGELIKAPFSQLKTLVNDVLRGIREDLRIKHIDFDVISDPEDQEESLLVEIYVDEKDTKQVIELWKKISTEIRNEVEKRLGDKSKDYQMRLQISVRPNL